MANGWEERFHALLAEILRVKYELPDVEKVTWFKEDSYETGVCETCAYTIHELTVGYEDFEGYGQTFNVEGTMSDFLYEPTV